MLKKAIRKSFISFTGVLSALILLASVGPAKAEVTIEVVALSGSEAPGTAGRTFLRFFSAPVVNALGEVALFATLDPSDSTNDTGIWAGTAGNLALVAREGDEAPDTPGRTFRALGGPLLDASGAVPFGAGLDLSNTTNDLGIWIGTPGKADHTDGTGFNAPFFDPSGEYRGALAAHCRYAAVFRYVDPRVVG